MKVGCRKVGIGCGLLALAFWLVLLVISRTALPLYRNTTQAMEPTVAAGDFVLTRPSDFAELRRRDLVVFKYPRDRRYVFVKRVVALPRDQVLIRDKRLFINGVQQDESYVVHTDWRVYPLDPALPEPYRSRDQFGPFVVPAGQFFVLGDSRDKSADSRFWGPVSAADLRGRVILVLSQTDGFRRVERPPN